MRTDDMINLLVQDLPSPAGTAAAQLRRFLPPAALAAGGIFLAVMGVRDDLVAVGLAPTAMKLGLGALLAAGAVAGALRLARPEAAPVAAGKWLLAVAALLVLVVAADIAGQGLAGWAARVFGRSVASCLVFIPTLASLPLAAALVALRQGATTAPATTGALAGLASAGLAILAYGLFCTEDSPLFVATWYSLAAAIAAGAGAVLGRALLRW